MKQSLIFIAILAVALTACSGGKKVKLIEKNFEDEIAPQTALSFTFNQEMVPDSLLGQWTEVEYIKFDPAASGKFQWQTNNRLVFIPSEGFKPSTDYSGKLSDKVFSYLKNAKYVSDKEFSFHTPYLKVLGSRAFWQVDEASGIHGIKVELEFNYPVIPAQVKDLVSIKVKNEVKPVELISDENTEIVSFIVSGIQKEDQDYPVEIKLDKGLGVSGGSKKTDAVFVEQFDIPSPFKLEITDVQANHDGNEGSITLYTTQQASEEDLSKYITIKPGVRYTVESQPGYILIKSASFSMDQHYEISLKEGLTGKLGGKLKYDFSQPVSFGEVEPTIKFYEDKEYYLSGNGTRNMQVAILNVPKVKIKVSKIYENNLLSFLRNSYDYDYYYDYESRDYYYYNTYNVGDFGDVVYEEEIETNTLPSKGSNKILTLDFEDKLAQNKGIYVLEVRSEDKHWLRASKIVAISDIGLIVKEGKNQIVVFANSIKTAKPLADVELKFIGRNNQLTHTMKTNADGVAIYEFDEYKAPGFETAMISAQLSSDYNVIPLDRTRINTSRFDVGGKHMNPSGIEAFLYGDRNLYRPGETLNISAIVRNSEWQSPGNIPVILKFIAPNGKTYKTIRKILTEYGSFETQINLPASAQTGSYVANVFTTNEVLIGSQIIKVEEFMPDRIKVKVDLDKPDYEPGEDIEVDIEAMNFFGPPAANRNYEVQYTTQQTYFYAKDFRDYNFSIQESYGTMTNIVRENTTNSEGKASESFNIPAEFKNRGKVQADVFVTVFDETGRPVNRLKRVNIFTQKVFYGLRSDYYYVKTNQPVKVDLVAVDKEGKAQTGVEAEVTLIRHEYKTVLSKSGSYFRYRSEEIEKVVEKKTIKINETSTSYGFIPEFSGRYEVRVTSPGVSTYVSRSLYAYGWGSTTYSSFKVDNEGEINIETDKDNYAPGEKANILLKAPFSGKILITVESNKVLDHYYIETDKRAASIEIPVKEEYLPNVFISATLFRPHTESDIPLTVAHGYASLKVDNPSYKIPITIDVPEKSRSNKQQTIKVKGKPNSALTIAIVDEGILQVAGMATPDPYNFFYQKRALGVNSSNIYPYLFPEVGMVRSTTGGGMGEEEAKRLNPLQSNRVKLVSFWSGIIETNSRGEAEYTIDIPQFSGDLRIMAISYNGKEFGSAQENMKVADPLVMSVALPRFLSPGDKVIMPVVLTNTTDKEINCKTNIKLEGPLSIEGEKVQNVKIAPNQEAEVVYHVNANMETGMSKITVEADAMKETFVNTTEITVRPASPLQKRSGAGQITAGQSKTMDINVEGFIESSIDGKVVISKNPLVQFTKSLDYLVRYPYGCAEQTVSSAFPQIYYGDLIGTVFKSEKAQTDAVRNVQYALDRIKLMQLYNGGLTYWPGHGTESWWSSVYAAHFALEAQKAGYEVDEDFLKALLNYLKKKLREKELVTYYYNEYEKRQIAPRSAIYSLYVLAQAGEKPTALLNYYRSRTDQLSLDSEYMLAAAYGLTGDMDKARTVMPKAFEGEQSVTSLSGSFYSPVRDEALALNVLLEVDPDNPQIGLMAKHVSDALANKHYLNTQERSFGLMAMGKIAKMAAASDVKGTVTAGGKTIGNFNNSDLTLTLNETGSKTLQVKTEGSGKLYYYWESEGISSDGSYKEEDKYMVVRKNFYNRHGGLITNNHFEQNDLVLVELAITGSTNRSIENVAISDILPACFEIENPRLTTLPPGMKFPHSRSTPEYMDIRDDRINMFTTVSSYTRHYYYLVRVVSKGEFNMGPVGADAMYNGEYHSYSGAGVIVVE